MPHERRVIIPTDDHDATLAWHSAVFAWPIVRQWPGGTLVAIDEHTRLEILAGNPDFPPADLSTGAALAVEVADIDALHALAVAYGATVVTPPVDRPWGHRNVTLRDPNGLTVVAFCPLA